MLMWGSLNAEVQNSHKYGWHKGVKSTAGSCSSSSQKALCRGDPSANVSTGCPPQQPLLLHPKKSPLGLLWIILIYNVLYSYVYTSTFHISDHSKSEISCKHGYDSKWLWSYGRFLLWYLRACASTHGCTEIETYVAWHNSTVYEQIPWSNHKQCITKPKVVILNIYATKLHIHIHLSVKLNYNCSWHLEFQTSMTL